MDQKAIDDKLYIEIEKLDKHQKEKLIKYLCFHYIPDEWQLGMTDVRNKIYGAYSSEIAGLIAKIEVYAHDLPPRVGSLVEGLWHLLTTATVARDGREKAEAYKSLEKYVIHVINELRMILAELYVNTVRGYIKTLKNFNYQSILDENNCVVLEIVKSNIKLISKLMREGKRSRRSYFCKSRFGFKYETLNYEKVFEISQFSEALNVAETTVKLCEKFYPKIIGNGYSSTLPKRVLSALPDIIAFVFTVLGFVQLIRLIYSFVS